VVVLEDREDELAGSERVLSVTALALVDVPAVVLEPGAMAGRDVDLLGRVLPDVSDVEVAGRTVEAEAPGVAEPERSNRPG
jgi:hypothetical protein